jgi:hypothetical protein
LRIAATTTQKTQRLLEHLKSSLARPRGQGSRIFAGSKSRNLFAAIQLDRTATTPNFVPLNLTAVFSSHRLEEFELNLALTAWRMRSLDPVWPIVYFGGIVMHVRGTSGRARPDGQTPPC